MKLYLSPSEARAIINLHAPNNSFKFQVGELAWMVKNGQMLSGIVVLTDDAEYTVMWSNGFEYTYPHTWARQYTHTVASKFIEANNEKQRMKVLQSQLGVRIRS
jgi:hypothetical protein